MLKIILLLLSFFPVVLFSQFKITNESLVYPEKRILYYGAENVIKVHDADSLEQVMLNSRRDTILNYGSTFYYRSLRGVEYDTLSLLLNDEVLDTAIFKVKLLRKPRIFLGENYDTTVTKDYILSNPGLQVSYYPDIFSIEGCRILRFDASLIKKGSGEEISLRDYRHEELEKFYDNNDFAEEEDSLYWEFRRVNSDMFDHPHKFSNKSLNRLKSADVGEVLWIKWIVYRFPYSASIKRTVNLKLMIVE